MNSSDKLKKYSLIFIALAIIGLFISFPILNAPSKPEADSLTDASTIKLKHTNSNKVLSAQVAVSEAKKAQGFMNDNNIGDNDAMLFIFGSLQELTFWMKDTPTSLDIIFLDNDMKVVSFYVNTKPNQTTEIYPSIFPARYAIETKAGWANSVKLTTGDSFEIL